MSNTIYIIQKDINYNVDKYIAATVLAKGISSRTKSEVKVVVPKSFNKELYSNIYSTQIEFVNDVVAINNKIVVPVGTEVKDLKWELVNGNIEIRILDNQEKEIEFKDKISPKSPNIKVVLLNTNPKFVEKFNLKSESSDIVYIGKKDYQQVFIENFISEESNSNVELAARYILLNNLHLDPIDATALITGIIIRTENFTNHYATNNTVKLVNQLVERGGDIQIASRKVNLSGVNKSTTLIAKHVIDSQDNNSDSILLKTEKDVLEGIYHSTQRNLIGKKLIELLPNKNVALFSEGEGRNLALLITRDRNSRLNKLFKHLNFSGSNLSGWIVEKEGLNLMHIIAEALEIDLRSIGFINRTHIKADLEETKAPIQNEVEIENIVKNHELKSASDDSTTVNNSNDAPSFNWNPFSGFVKEEDPLKPAE